jgi:exoribonuclease R
MVDTDEMISLNYVLDEKNYKFINSNSSKISLGDNVKVKVNGVNLTKRQIDLSLVL